MDNLLLLKIIFVVFKLALGEIQRGIVPVVFSQSLTMLRGQTKRLVFSKQVSLHDANTTPCIRGQCIFFQFPEAVETVKTSIALVEMM